MAKNGKATKTGKHGADGRDDRRAVVVSTSIEVMAWRLREAATRIQEAADAVSRDDPDRALDRLLEIEPLVFEVERALSAVFLLAREAGARSIDRPNAST
jgi:hypothetical protein